MPLLNWIGKEKIITHQEEVPFRVLEHLMDLIARIKGGLATSGQTSLETNTNNSWYSSPKK